MRNRRVWQCSRWCRWGSFGEWRRILADQRTGKVGNSCHWKPASLSICISFPILCEQGISAFLGCFTRLLLLILYLPQSCLQAGAWWVSPVSPCVQLCKWIQGLPTSPGVQRGLTKCHNSVLKTGGDLMWGKRKICSGETGGRIWISLEHRLSHRLPESQGLPVGQH